MKFFATICFLSLTIFSAHAESKSSRESVEQLMELTEASKMIDAIHEQISVMFDGMYKQMGITQTERPAFENYMKKTANLLERELNWNSFKEPMIDIYTKHFSEEEVKGLIRFYQSDLGRSMTEKMPLLMQDSMLISQQQMKEVMPKIQALALELQQEILKSRQP